MGIYDALEFDRLEALINGQGDVLEMIAMGTSIVDVFEAITRWVENQGSDGLMASLLFADELGKHLLHGAAPSLPADYNTSVHGVDIAYGVGSCGTAAFLKQDVIVEDIANDPLWKDYKELALGFGLGACWSTPLISKAGKVLGTFAIYYPTARKPTPFDLQILRLVNRTAVIAIEYKLAQDEQVRLKNSEQVAYDKVIKERQQFYNLLMEAPALIAILKGPQHVYDLINPPYEKVVANKRSILGKPIREALPELASQGIFPILDEVYRTGIPYVNDELLVKLDRNATGVLEDIYFNFIFQPIRDPSGEIEGIFIHAVDLTELVMEKKRAASSEELFRSFVLNSPKPIGIYVGREMRIQTANDAILEAWEKDKSVIGKTYREALPELEGQPFYGLLDEVFTTGIPYHATEDKVLLYRNGVLTTTYYNFSFTPLRDENGQIYGVMNTAAEVTDLVVAKQQLADAKENLRTAIDLAELGTWQLDYTNDTLYYSTRVQHWFGLPDEKCSLAEVMEAIHEDDRERVAHTVERAIAAKEPYQSEYRVINKKTGEDRVLHAQGKVFLNDKGEAELLNGTAKDVTLQRITEQRLAELVETRTAELKKANLELHNVNENLQQFVYIASHDLQEPLRKINIFSDMLQKKHHDELDMSGQKYLDKIAEASKRMAQLIKDLLDFSRVGSIEKQSIKTDLNELINYLLTDYELLIEQKQAVINIGELCTITAVPLQMNQLFYNLIGNALKFSKPKVPPVININCRLLEGNELKQYDTLNQYKKYCEIIVKDEGIGFEQYLAEQIFVIFKRLHGRDQYEGTGIGLALCKKIVDNHHGHIFANSVEGEGTEFHVILPLE